jgi:uncharacterized protein (TIGR03790 family)
VKAHARGRTAIRTDRLAWATAVFLSVLTARPAGALDATDLAVVINSDDPLSVAVGAYYATARHVPAANIVHVHLDPKRDDVAPEDFKRLKHAADGKLAAHVQAYALTWTRPYRVGCMSITSAFAFGFDDKFCATGCTPTAASPYFDSHLGRPYDALHLRPAMSIAALDFVRAKALIDRGIAADGTSPGGTVYLVRGGDRLRGVRETQYPLAAAVARFRGLSVDDTHDAALSGRTDVLFYFIGSADVPSLTTNHFLPGALADHLTSFGGMLTDSSQMSSLRWLEAGASGSYGTVVEPCNMAAKFPDIPLLIAHYSAGETVLESYWKSVLMPGQGLFIGEPLAAPYPAR